jgi:hypothetical protein
MAPTEKQVKAAAQAILDTEERLAEAVGGAPSGDLEWFMPHARAAIAAYHEALEADGWQVVPKVPSEAMAQAANDTWPESGKWMVSDVGRHVYAAMLSAAPTPKGRDGST